MIFISLVGFSLYQGWNRSATDFPNYYTAAVLVRKGERLRNYYDWTWFQRQMNYGGIERQLGGYIPQTPLTMLPLVPVATLPVQTAKRVWLAADIVFLAAVIGLLSCITRLHAATIAFLVVAGYGALHVNLLLGQYYVFLLFLLTLAVFCLQRNRPYSAGALLGIVFGLKLYGGPFLLYFAARRNWRALAGMLTASLLLGVVAIALFGWPDVTYFATDVLPRAVKGETLDPYNAGNGTISTLLRRTFLPEPELNPHPLLNVPEAFFFLQPLLSFAILTFPLLAFSRSKSLTIGFAGFLIALVLASPNTASYTFVLLLLPVSLLFAEAERRKQIILVLCYFLSAMPMRPSWNWLFPKIWCLLVLLLVAGHGCWHFRKWKPVLLSAVAIVLTAMLLARNSVIAYRQEPGQRWKQVAVERGALYSSSPAVLRSGVIYESLGADRYLLRWQHDGRIEPLLFDGHALHPLALSPDGPILFELVAHGFSTLNLFSPMTGRTIPAPPRTYPTSPGAVSPDRKWLVFTRRSSGAQQIWLREIGGKRLIRVTGGNCNSFSPVWEWDSQSILFASDCSRGLGLPALYRAPLQSLLP